jgi:hypothetical protein
MWLSGGESDQSWNDIFIAAEGGSRVVWGGPAEVVQIQCFSFDSRGNTVGQSVVGR